ncbi:hypothetical protein LTR85_001014 [Meristemomyces frigidus]|nr:hypothetical protein LTR85_001014 [Meristemomyces frigidus]
MADQEAFDGPLFRASKRRKIFRRRDEEGGEGDATDEHWSGKNTLDGGGRAAVDDAHEPSSPPALQVQRKPVARKYGIAFNSTNKPQAQPQQQNEEMAMIPTLPSQEQSVGPIDRFVKPTGKAAVVDDRHMLAFVDTKLAEMRSSSSTPHANKETPQDRSEQALLESGNSDPQRTHASDATMSSARFRPNKQQNVRARRPPPARDAGHAARDSLVDQIMKESAVPLYDRSASATPYRPTGGTDNDAAVMEAFKAEFLAEMEEHKKRKPPAPPAGTKGVVPTSNGPKLGGSRSQREKMKAMEANKSGAKK